MAPKHFCSNIQLFKFSNFEYPVKVSIDYTYLLIVLYIPVLIVSLEPLIFL